MTPAQRLAKSAPPLAFLAFLAALFAGAGPAQEGACLLTLLLCACADAGVLRSCARPRWWIFPILFALLTPLLVGAKGLSILGRPYSGSQLRAGLGFLLQAYAFTVFAATVSRTYSARQVVSAFERAGLRSVGLRLALAAAATRGLDRMLRESYESYRLDRPGTWPALRDAPLLFAALARGAERAAEELSILLYLRNVRA